MGYILQQNPRVQEEIICPPSLIQTICSRKELCFSNTMLVFKRMALETHCAPDNTDVSLYVLPVWFSVIREFEYLLKVRSVLGTQSFSCGCKRLFNIYILALLSVSVIHRHTCAWAHSRMGTHRGSFNYLVQQDMKLTFVLGVLVYQRSLLDD